MEHEAVDPLTEATQLNDYRHGVDGGCPACWDHEGRETDAETVANLLAEHTPEELAWALLAESAKVFRLHDYIIYRHDYGKDGPVPYGVTSASPETDAEIDEVQATVAATAKRQMPPHVARGLGM